METTHFEDLRSRSISQRLQEAEEFFIKQGPAFSTLERLARRLKEEAIPYAVVGGMALNLYGYERMTRDVDVLMTSAALQKFVERCVGRGYVPAFPGARKSFRDTASQVAVEVLFTGEYPGDGKPKPVAFPDPETTSVEINTIRVISLEKLIELKLASGLSASHRLRDLADVQDLIMTLSLPLELGERLDESVRGEYQRLWEAARGARLGGE
ncbi:MAG: hypothetical protein ACRDH2_02935 [Anaerolineales bacterium]